MRIAALYDIHGNLPALEATVDALRRERPDLIVVGGDVLPGPMANGCLDLLRALPVPAVFLKGNGEREVLSVRRGETPNVPAAYHAMMRWAANELTVPHAEWINGWPATICLEDEGATTIFCHATPTSDVAIVTPRSSADTLRRAFGEVRADRWICGHTHIQFRLTFSPGEILNAGSVGMPSGGGAAQWLWLTPTSAEFRETEYDRTAAATRVLQTAYPLATEFAQTSILNPPTYEHMLSAYSPLAP